jgi:tetratricopeptide (TPR) repeat protein
MTWYWFLRGRLTEARRALISALAIDGEAAASARAFATAWVAGIRLLAGGDGDAAAALKPYHGVADPARQAEAEWILGFATSDFGDLSLSEDLIGRALTAFRAAGDRWGVAAALSTRAKHAAARGDLAAVEDHGQRSLSLFRELGDRWGQLQATEWLGSRCESIGDYEQGRRLHREGLQMAQELGLWPQAADRLTWLGRIAMLTGDYARARELLEEARRLAAGQAYKPGEIFADISLGALARREGDLDSADACLRNVLDWHREMGYAPDVGKAMALAELGFVAEQRGDPVAARHYHAEALAIARELGDPRGIGLTLEASGAAGTGGPGLVNYPGPSAYGLRTGVPDRVCEVVVPEVESVIGQLKRARADRAGPDGPGRDGWCWRAPRWWRGWRYRAAAGSYDVDAAFMPFQRHGWDIHAVSAERGRNRERDQRPQEHPGNAEAPGAAAGPGRRPPVISPGPCLRWLRRARGRGGESCGTN